MTTLRRFSFFCVVSASCAMVHGMEVSLTVQEHERSGREAVFSMSAPSSNACSIKTHSMELLDRFPTLCNWVKKYSSPELLDNGKECWFFGNRKQRDTELSLPLSAFVTERTAIDALWSALAKSSNAFGTPEFLFDIEKEYDGSNLRLFNILADVAQENSRPSLGDYIYPNEHYKINTAQYFEFASQSLCYASSLVRTFGTYYDGRNVMMDLKGSVYLDTFIATHRFAWLQRQKSLPKPHDIIPHCEVLERRVRKMIQEMLDAEKKGAISEDILWDGINLIIDGKRIIRKWLTKDHVHITLYDPDLESNKKVRDMMLPYDPAYNIRSVLYSEKECTLYVWASQYGNPSVAYDPNHRHRLLQYSLDTVDRPWKLTGFWEIPTIERNTSYLEYSDAASPKIIALTSSEENAYPTIEIEPSCKFLSVIFRGSCVLKPKIDCQQGSAKELHEERQFVFSPLRWLSRLFTVLYVRFYREYPKDLMWARFMKRCFGV